MADLVPNQDCRTVQEKQVKDSFCCSITWSRIKFCKTFSPFINCQSGLRAVKKQLSAPCRTPEKRYPALAAAPFLQSAHQGLHCQQTRFLSWSCQILMRLHWDVQEFRILNVDTFHPQNMLIWYRKDRSDGLFPLKAFSKHTVGKNRQNWTRITF